MLTLVDAPGIQTSSGSIMTILIWPTNMSTVNSSVLTSHGKVLHAGGIACFSVMARNTAVNFHRADSEIRTIRVDLTIRTWFPDLDGIECVAIVNE